MKYQSVYGIYSVVVDADNKDDAVKAIEKKISKYKEGSSKGDYIRKQLANGVKHNPFMVYFKDGFYREVTA